MGRAARRHNVAVGTVLEEAQQNLLSSFMKSAKTQHRGLKGDARAKSIATFLEKRLPAGFGILAKSEIVDYLDHRSPELDIVLFDKIRNSVLSDDPVWIAAESVLAYIEVKSTLTAQELEKSYAASAAVQTLRPFKLAFSLASRKDDSDQGSTDKQNECDTPRILRCFRTVFAYESNLAPKDWLDREWERLIEITNKVSCSPNLIDRILVLDRGMISPPFNGGTDNSQLATVFQQWYVHLVNFLIRENGRRPPFDLQTYSQRKLPGWKYFSRKQTDTVSS